MPNATATLLTAIVFTSFLVAGLLGFVIASYIRLSNKYMDLKNKVHDEDRAKRKITDEILHKSYKEAQNYVLIAKRRSEELIKDTQFFTGKQEDDFRKVLDQVTNQQLEIYQNTLKDIKEDNQILFDKFLTDTKKEKDEQVHLFMDQLRQEIEVSSKSYKDEIGKLTLELKNSFDAEHEIVLNELIQYKNMMIENMDKKIVDVVKDVITEVVSVGLSLSDREDMVMQSLEDAKKKFGLDGESNRKHKPESDKP